MLVPMFCAYIPFPCPSDPQGCYTDAECHWCPDFAFDEPQIYSLVGPEGQCLRADPLRVEQAIDFIRHYGPMASARAELIA